MGRSCSALLVTVGLAALALAPAASAADSEAAPAPSATASAPKVKSARKAKHATTAPSAAPSATSETVARADGAPAGNDAKAQPAAAATSDSAMVLAGGEEGTVFKSLTVTGEDLIHIDFDRPELHVSADPRTAPGLEWGNSQDLLRRSGVDLNAPLTALSRTDTSPYTGRPWLSSFRSGAVARFRPQLKNVEHWSLTIADSRSDTLATFEGKGNPPDEIAWDGRSRKGSAVPPGVTCSYVVDAIDRAGNRRSFVGSGFVLPAYRLQTPSAEMLLFAGEDLGDAAALGPGTAPAPILLEAASWLNQLEPVGGAIEVKASARSFEDASRLAKLVVDALKPRVVGDPARFRAVADVRPDVPPRGTVAITASAQAPKGSS